MSVTIKSKSDIQKLREAGRIAANALVHAGKVIHPGMTTKQLDKSIHDFIVGCGAVPTFWDTAVFRQVPAFRSTTRSFTVSPVTNA